jgi:CRISPR/Cas system CSM-associated protein Csm2 small subunit
VAMTDEDTSKEPEISRNSQSDFAGLKGRQSVRATFKLTNDCIEAISIVAGQLGIKQKSLFDHLFQDTDTLSAIARKFRNARLQTTNRIQKTYVISRNALVSLEDISKHFNAPRDVLIEFSVQRLMPIIANERQRHSKRKELFDKIQQHLETGRKLLKETYAELGEEDPMTDRLSAAMGTYESAFKQMAALVERGKIIEEFEPSSLQKVNVVFEVD